MKGKLQGILHPLVITKHEVEFACDVPSAPKDTRNSRKQKVKTLIFIVAWNDLSEMKATSVSLPENIMNSLRYSCTGHPHGVLGVGAGGGGNCHFKLTGVTVENFERNPCCGCDSH